MYGGREAMKVILVCTSYLYAVQDRAAGGSHFAEQGLTTRRADNSIQGISWRVRKSHG